MHKIDVCEYVFVCVVNVCVHDWHKTTCFSCTVAVWVCESRRLPSLQVVLFGVVGQRKKKDPRAHKRTCMSARLVPDRAALVIATLALYNISLTCDAASASLRPLRSR